MAKYFVSYSRKNTDAVDKIVDYLEANNISVWVDREDIRGGDQWRRQIVTNIEKCEAFILILSAGSIASDNVRKEIDLAEQYGKRIIPVALEDVNIPKGMAYQLVGIQRINMSNVTDNSLNALVKAIRAEATQPRPKATPPKKASGGELSKGRHIGKVLWYFAVAGFFVNLIGSPLYGARYSSNAMLSGVVEAILPAMGIFAAWGLVTGLVLPPTLANHAWIKKQLRTGVMVFLVIGLLVYQTEREILSYLMIGGPLYFVFAALGRRSKA